MTMQLISMTDFVLSQSEKYLNGHITLTNFHKFTMNYANFLKQPLELGMFVPVKDNELLKEPEISDYDEEELQASVMGVDVVNYNEAKEKLLFDGFKTIGTKHIEIVISKHPVSVGVGFKNGTHQIIEDLCKHPIPLTKTAINQIFN